MPTLTPIVFDLRSQQKPAGPDPQCGRISHGALVLRDPATIDAICLHQTGVARFGARAAHVKAEGGDKQRGRWRRALGVHAHVTAFSDGGIVPAYPLRAFVFHGNSSNSRSIGLEVEGLLAGRPGAGAEPDALTIETAREAIRWIVSEAAKEGIAVKYIVAHRQYSQSRRADPGWKLWREVAMTCELDALPTLVEGGRQIPECWDARQRGIPY